MFLGFDCSTQSFKAIVTDVNGAVTHQWAVNFERELGNVYPIQDGMTRHIGEPGKITAPTLMWFHGLDLVLEEAMKDGFDFSNITALSGSGQQHGSVYWTQNASKILSSLDPSKQLHQQLKEAFQIQDSPIWADSSTTGQCRRLEFMLGGPPKVAQRTGSRAYERFTGNQIARLYERWPQLLNECARVSLVSSAIASVLLGTFAEIDFGDGSGMNMMSLFHKSWDSQILDCIMPQLQDKLGNLVASNTVLGNVSSYFVERYGFSENCQVVAWTGDNLNSFASMGLREGRIALSLGTSDTVFGASNHPKPSTQGHVFVNPVDENSYMVMLCFKNGSLVRESFLRDPTNTITTWEYFNNALLDTTPGNNGILGIFHDLPEITPQTNKTGRFFFGADDQKLESSSVNVQQQIRAAVEYRMIAAKAYCSSIGITFPLQQVLVTGGASGNSNILQVVADVFGAPVFKENMTTESAAFGAALRAQHATSLSKLPFEQSVQIPKQILQAEPRSTLTIMYDEMVQRYLKLVRDHSIL